MLFVHLLILALNDYKMEFHLLCHKMNDPLNGDFNICLF